jgi:hypothetical protein
VIEQAVLTGAPAAAAGEIRMASPGVEKAIEASLQPAVTSEPAKPAAAKPADAQLIPPQPVAAGS